MKWVSECAFFNFLTRIAIAMSLCVAISEASYYTVRRKTVQPNSTDALPSPRIHGGYEAQEEQFKFMVFLLISHTRDLRDPALTCTASLINEKWILTAAHCVMPAQTPPSVIAVAGRANLQEYYRRRVELPFHKHIDEERLGVQERRVVKVFVNPNYSKSIKYERDLALLLVNRPFETGANVETINLAERKMVERMSCTVIGWGLSDYQRQTLKLMFAEPVYAQTPDLSCVYIDSGPFICLDENGSGICKGDSGGPLVCDGKVWGVASFACSKNQDPACGNSEEEYYSQIYQDLEWVATVTEQRGGGKGSSSPTSSTCNSLIQMMILLAIKSAWIF